VQGVAGDPNALGFFGFAYYVENQEKLRVLPIDGGDGPVPPTRETIADGTYTPLSRPIFIYVRGQAAARPEVESFVHFYLDNAGTLAEEVGYVALPPDVSDLVRRRFEERVTGTVYDTEGAGQKPLLELYTLREP
jgi:phosphate transport system substrate-binding protein